MELNITYLRDQALTGHFDGLKYADFRRLFPDAKAGKFPRPETLLRDNPAPFLTAADLDIRLTVYPSGLYREPGEASVYAVSECARFEYRSVTGNLILTEEETAELPCFMPPILAVRTMRSVTATAVRITRSRSATTRIPSTNCRPIATRPILYRNRIRWRMSGRIAGGNTPP